MIHTWIQKKKETNRDRRIKLSATKEFKCRAKSNVCHACASGQVCRMYTAEIDIGIDVNMLYTNCQSRALMQYYVHVTT